MRRSLSPLLCLSFALTALLSPLTSAQQAGGTPPELQPQAQGKPAASAPRAEAPGEKNAAPQITQKRTANKVTEVTVHEGNNEYTIRPDSQVGTAQPGDAQGRSTSVPQWRVLQFNTRRPKPAPQSSAPGAPSDAPPPLPATSR